MDRGAWWATGHEVSKGRTQMSTHKQSDHSSPTDSNKTSSRAWPRGPSPGLGPSLRMASPDLGVWEGWGGEGRHFSYHPKNPLNPWMKVFFLPKIPMGHGLKSSKKTTWVLITTGMVTPKSNPASPSLRGKMPYVRFTRYNSQASS